MDSEDKELSVEEWREVFHDAVANWREAQATADRRGNLLKRLIDSGMLTTNEKLMCQEECEDCDLTREILKELGDEAQKQANEYIESESAHHKPEDFEDA